MIEGKPGIGTRKDQVCNEADRYDRHHHRKPIITPPLAGTRKYADPRRKLIPVIPKAIYVPRKPKILERMPGVQSLKRDVQLVNNRRDERSR